MEVLKIQEHLGRIKKMHDIILNFLEEEEENEDNFEKIIKFPENRHDMQLLLCILYRISNNHYRTHILYSRIEKIILSIKDKIKQTFSNYEIFENFKNNKKILLFLFKESIISIDKSIISVMTSIKFKEANYPQFFSTEINSISQEKIELNLTPEEFERKREIGQNDSIICELIRNDSVEEFITYITKNAISPSGQIQHSIFETNQFLIKNKNPTFIEYAAFFGSIQIFKFLRFQKAVLTPSLWLYSIHSNNAELIHILEEEHAQPADKTYQKCLKESIKCHHNEIAKYIQENLSDKNVEKNNLKSNFNENTLADNLHYHNYVFLEPQLLHRFLFYYACKYSYFTLVEFYLKLDGIDVNEKIIFSEKNSNKVLKFISIKFQY
ncbi:hypothetical protein M9Y10_011036 [Tritrichomonas musculus]|uniref:DUF3447 domain-containing protein n=1 Tax=Tritrichomonas musculus TaxID=1915356 RepID=A0ABR2IN84_9EUKA